MSVREVSITFIMLLRTVSDSKVVNQAAQGSSDRFGKAALGHVLEKHEKGTMESIEHKHNS